MKAVNGNHIYEGESIPVNASGFNKNLATTDNTIAKVFTKLDQLVASGGSQTTYNINPQSGTTYTLVLTDSGGLITMNNASASTLTIPPNASVAFPVSTRIDVCQLGAGKVTIAPGSGVTIISQSNNKSIAAQYVGVSLIQITINSWLLLGNLIA